MEEEDGYKIVNEFLEYDYSNDRRVHNSILSKVGKGSYNRIFSKYDIDKDKRLENIPVWEFLEIITFGELVKFYRFFGEKYKLKEELDLVFMLLEVTKMRNCVCHDTIIFSELGVKDNKFPPKYQIVEFLQNSEISGYIRKIKLKNSRLYQITCTLYLFNEIVTSEGGRTKVKEELNNLFYGRIIRHKEYYTNNELLKSVYKYFDKIIQRYYN